MTQTASTATTESDEGRIGTSTASPPTTTDDVATSDEGTTAPSAEATVTPSPSTTSPTSPTVAASDWSVGAGVALPGLASDGVTLAAPRLSASVERRLDARLWFIADVRGGIDTASDIELGSSFKDTTNSGHLGVLAGVRYQLVDDTWRVRPSAFVALEASTRNAFRFDDDLNNDSQALVAEENTLSLGLAGGGAVDVTVIEAVVLRFAATVVEASASRTQLIRHLDDEGSDISATATNGRIGVGVQPAIQLRVFL